MKIQDWRKAWTKPIVWILITTMVSGCSTMQPVSLSTDSTIAEYVQAGDKVEITTYSDEVFGFEVTEVSEDYISGRYHQVFISDVANLDVKRMRVGATVALIAGVTFVGLGIIAASGAIAAVTW